MPPTKDERQQAIKPPIHDPTDSSDQIAALTDFFDLQHDDIGQDGDPKTPSSMETFQIEIPDYQAHQKAVNSLFFKHLLPRLMTREGVFERFFHWCQHRDARLWSAQAMMTHPSSSLKAIQGRSQRVESFFWGGSLVVRLIYPTVFIILSVLDAANVALLARPDQLAAYVSFSVLYGSPLLFGTVCALINTSKQREKHLLTLVLNTPQVLTSRSIMTCLYWLDKFTEKHELYGESKASLLKALRRTASGKGRQPLGYRLLSHHALWSLGLSDSLLSQVFFPMLLYPLTLFTVYQYWRFLVLNLMAIQQYQSEQSACKAQGRFYVWQAIKDSYACDACPWNFVDLASRRNVSLCLNRLWAHGRSSDVLIQSLTDMSDVSASVGRVDFSKQDWVNWPVAMLSQVLDSVMRFSLTIASLNLSSPEGLLLSADQANAIAMCLRQLDRLRQLDLSGVLFPDQSLALVTDAVIGKPLQSVYLDHSGVNGTGLFFWADALKTDLTEWSVAALDVSGSGAELAQLPVLPLCRSLSLSEAQLSQASLDALSEWLLRLPLAHIDLSSTSLDGYDASSFFASIAQVNRVSVSSCSLGDDGLIAAVRAWGNGSITELSIADNDIGGRGFRYFFSNIPELLALDVSYNALEEAVPECVAYLSVNALSTLDVSGNYLLDDQLSAFSSVVFDAVSERLMMSGITLSEEAFAALLNDFNQSSSALWYWDLSQTDLSYQSVTALFEWMPSTALRSVSLAGVSLADPLPDFLWYDCLSGDGSLLSLDLSKTRLGSDNLYALMQSLDADSPLEVLNVADNFDEEASSAVLVDALSAVSPAGVPQQNNSLQQLSLSGNTMSNSSLRTLCEDLVFFDSLRIESVTFGAEQLAQSKFVGVPGCPAATSSASSSMPSLLVLFGLLLFYYLSCFNGHTKNRQDRKHGARRWGLTTPPKTMPAQLLTRSAS